MNASPKRAAIDAASPVAPVILNARQELFAQAVAAGKPASPAYREIYGCSLKASEAHGPRLVGNGRVKARIAQLLAQNAAAQSVTIEFITKNLIDVYRLAVVEKQANAAVQAMMGVAKLHGLIVDKVQADVLIRKPSASPESPDDMSAEDWLHDFAGPKITLTAEPVATSVSTPVSAATPEPRPVQAPVQEPVSTSAPPAAEPEPAPAPAPAPEPEPEAEQPEPTQPPQAAMTQPKAMTPRSKPEPSESERLFGVIIDMNN
jgi:hypothetical protein